MKLKEINLLTRTAYNVCAQKYHDLFKDELSNKEFDRKILNDFSGYFNTGDVIYDIGCGPSGHIGYYLHKKGLEVIGIDISDNCIEIAKLFHPTMKFIRMNMFKMDINDNSADGIISYYSIIHTPKKYIDKILMEYRRILKKGGIILLTVKEGNSEGLEENFLETGKHIFFSYFTKDEIKHCLQNNGFNILLIESRTPLEDEIAVNRVYALAEKI